MERGFDEKRIRFIPLGVDTEHFRLTTAHDFTGRGPVRAAMVGRTERDHEFLASVFRAIHLT